jgi:hypothetical protein
VNQQNVNLFYVDANLLQKLESNPRSQEFLTDPGSMGWKLTAMEDSGDRWLLFQKLQRNGAA